MNEHEPTAEEEESTPRPAQTEIIESDEYPMRVLAGAGTGKTFTMVRKVERLIRDGVPPERILALTFTNNAADSMREKLVDRIGPQGHDITAATYHSICNDLLGEYAYHAGIDPRSDIATDADRLAIVYDVLDEMPYRFTNPDVYADLDYTSGAADNLLQFVQVMKRSGITPAELRDYLVSPERLLELDRITDGISEAVEEHLRVGWWKMTDDRLDELCTGLDSLIQLLETERGSLAEDGMEADVRAYLAVMIDAADALQRFLREHEAAILADDERFEDVQKLPAYLFGSYSGSPTGMPKLDYTFPDGLEAFLDECKMISDLVHGYEAYQQELREQDLLDFNDLVLETVALLQDDTIEEWITSQYDYVFCDEYQDTDTVQFELVQRLLNHDRLFVVGDDDQAIYEWRGANIENIGPRLTDAYPDLTDRELAENFRSREPILELANNALDHLDRRGSSKTLTATEDRKDADQGVVTITGAEEDDEQAAQITNAITRLLTAETDFADSAYAPGDIAVLVRKKKHAKPIAAALNQAGIPYELGGDIAPESIGVNTEIAGLKAIADPADEVSLNRLLRMRYRLCEADLRRLNGVDEEVESLQEALLDMPFDVFEEPDRVERARDDLAELWGVRDAESLTGLYRSLKETLNIEWFLSRQERRDLRTLDELIANFEDGAVEPELSSGFIEFLGRHGAITEGSSQSMEDQPDTDSAAVSIMTVHKSKGLEFPIVILPRLEAGEWEPRARSFDQIEHAVTGGNPAAVDFKKQDERESRRLFHVGITRAEDLSILVGRFDDEDDSDSEAGISVADVEALLDGVVSRSVAGVSFPIWDTVQSSLPETAVDGTDTLATPVDSWARVGALEHGEELSRREAQTRILTFAREMLDRDLPVAAGEASEISPGLLAEPTEPALLRRHSYTSLDTLATCTRKHYLDHVVRAFSDPWPRSVGGASSGVSVRLIGVVFHDTAERAANRGLTSPQEWKQLGRQIAAARGDEAAIPAVEECIDRYFEMSLPEWTLLSAERPFEITLNDEVVTGKIDAIYRTPEDELVVIDYKATDHKRSLESDYQLPIYLLACREILDEPVVTAGYAYVGSVGPSLETRTFSSSELTAIETELGSRVEAASASSYVEYSTGEHCRWCPHNSLACSGIESNRGR